MMSDGLDSRSVISQIKTDFSNPLKIIETGAKTLKFSNYGWLLTVPLILLNLIIFPFMGFELLIIAGMAIFVMTIIVLLVIDIAGFTILGIGLIKSEKHRNSSIKAGIAFLSWSLFSITWRIIVCINIVGNQIVDRDLKYQLYGLIQWSYLLGSLALVLAAIFLVKAFDGTLPFIVYSCINFLAAYFTGPVFIFTTDEIYVFIGTLVLMIIIFKLLVIPSLAIASFNGLIETVRVRRASEESDSGSKYAVRTAYLDVKVKKAHIESYEGFRGKTVTEQKKVQHAVIECPKCKHHYPVNTIHVNCLYCGEILTQKRQVNPST
ncbi:MAG: hypothetical protein ACTSP4_14550 [Candidatus Hodarchaeales archaeon]